MRKTKKVTKTEVVTETVDILCNKCGKTCDNVVRQGFAKKNPHKEFYGLIEQEVHGGYNSATIGDMTSWRFSLCEYCLDDLVKSFKIPHEIRDHDVSGDYITLVKNAKLVARAYKQSHQEWVSAILKQKSGYKKKDLQAKTHKELYEIYHQLNKKANQD
jgi:hypothetical protein